MVYDVFESNYLWRVIWYDFAVCPQFDIKVYFRARIFVQVRIVRFELKLMK